MHSHERTMLARLGFADPDRREQMHDIACQYLASPEAIQRLFRHLRFEHGPEPYSENTPSENEVAQIARRVRSYQVNRECHIWKGVGQYRTTVGFADVAVELIVESHFCEVQKQTRSVRDGRGNLTWTEWHPAANRVEQWNEELGIEVKVTPVAISDVVRQVKLYRSYSGIRTWIVATTYQITCADFECLQNERIGHVYLGAHFEAFVAAQRATDRAVSTEV